MGQDSKTFPFPGPLYENQLSGRGRVAFARTITRVELVTRGASPTVAPTFKVTLDAVAQAQEFTLTAGLAYREINVAGAGIVCGANVFLDVICTTPGVANDVDVTLHYTTTANIGIESTEDLGLGTLLELKRRLLNEGIIVETEHDANIAAIGRGVAGLFDQHCNRLFARAVGAQETFAALRDHWIVRRYPLEAVTTLELRDDLTSGWVAQTPAAQNWDAATGIVDFGRNLGGYRTQARLTYTGGYWVDVTVDGTGELPVGATALPAAIKEAWYLQCGAVWQAIDKLGLAHAEALAGGTAATVAKLAALDLTPQVKRMLGAHQRMALL